MTEVGTKVKRPPGRPKGYPRSGGRAKGVPNKSTQLGRDFIIKRGAPIEILCKIAKGEKIQAAADSASAAKRNGIYPTIDQRLAAARILAAKIVPDLKSSEITGAQGEPLSVQINLGS
jgi:hypothetical protein